MTGMGMHPPIPLDQARAASKAVADQTLRDEIEFLRGEVADIQRRADRLATAWAEAKAERDALRAQVDAFARFNRGMNPLRLTVVEPDDDELNASIARHPAGKGRNK